MVATQHPPQRTTVRRPAARRQVARYKSIHRDGRLTNLGGPWTGASFLSPLWAWGAVFGAAAAAHESRARGLWGVPAGWELWLWPAGVLLTAVAVIVAVGMYSGEKYANVVRGYMLYSALTMGAWATVGVAGGVLWHPMSLLACGVFALVGAACWYRVRETQLDHEWELTHTATDVDGDGSGPGMDVEKPLSPEEQEARDWENWFARCGAAGMQFIQRQPHRNGFAIHMQLPEDGSVTYQTLTGMGSKMEVLFGRVLPEFRQEGMRPGAIRVQRARRGGRPITTEVYVFFDVRDILAETIMAAEKHEPRSVYDAFPCGRIVDGRALTLKLAEIHVMIAGQTRKGKTNLYDLLIEWLGGCEDAEIWAYCGKGGRLLRKWIGPYVRREIDPNTGRALDRPFIAWPAVHRTELERQLLAAIETARVRPRLMDGNKWIASKTHPAIFFIIDELAEGVGAHVGPSWSTDEDPTSGELSALLTRALSLSGGEGVWLLAATQRPTVTMSGSGDAKANFGGRIMLPLSNAGDVSDILEKRGPELSTMAKNLHHPGSVIVEGFGIEADAVPAKLGFMGDGEDLIHRVRRAVCAHTRHRPTLDAGTRQVVDRYGYSTAYVDPDRAAWMYGRDPARPLRRWKPGAVPAPSTAAPAPVGGGAVTTAALVAQTAEQMGLTEYMGDDNPFINPATSAGPQVDEAAEWARLAALHDEEMRERAARVLAGEPAEDEREEEEDQGGPVTYRALRDVMVRIVDKAGTSGTTVMDVWRRLGEMGRQPHRTTMYGWFDKLAAEGLVLNPSKRRDGLWYTPANWR